MALVLSSDQELVQKVVREFAATTLAPEATRIDRDSLFPRNHLGAMAGLGLLGMLVPAESGGAGTDTVSFLVAVEEAARASGTDATLLVLENTVLGLLLHRAASPAQKEALLAPLLAGRRVLAVALTEESGGSSLTNPHTTARPTASGGWSLFGSKAFVAAAPEADDYLVLAQVPDSGPTLFHVPRDAHGLHVTQPESVLGLRGLRLADLYFNHVPLPAAALLGAPGQALPTLKEPILLARLGVAAALVGLAQAAYEQSRAFAERRVQFGQPIVQFGAIRGFLADVEAELEAARATCYRAATLRDEGKPFEEDVYEARLLAHRIAVKGTRVAHKIHGGAGFMRDLPLERVSRDVRALMHLWDAQDITRSRLATHLLR